MTVRKSILIYNPVAGAKHHRDFVIRIRQWLENNNVLAEVISTTHKGHGIEIAHQFIKKGYNHLVVAGGDGTINEIASAIIQHKDVSLGIVPCGSGNGLARHLNIPTKLTGALETAFSYKTLAIDVAFLNGQPFFSVAGIGFDALIAHDFATMKSRGLKNYVRAVLRNFASYEPIEYSISFQNKEIRAKALMITFANSNQFGNNTSLAPGASLDDGLIDLCIMKKPDLASAVALSPLLFLKKMDKTRYLKIIKTAEARIAVPNPSYYHLDGDPHTSETSMFSLSVVPRLLNIHIQ